MKTYKLWIHIEEHDTETDVYRDLTDLHEVEACSIAVCATEKESIELSEQLHNVYYSGEIPNDIR